MRLPFTAKQLVGYYRVSTKQQGHDGLGMEAQRRAVAAYSVQTGIPVIASYAEVETGRKSDLRNRPQLVAALAFARRSHALLVIARLDRLARNVFVTSQLLESGVEFVACDVPYASRLTIQILAVMAEHESRLISERIRAANDAARARGVDFRRPDNQIAPWIQRLGTIAANREAIERSATVYRDLMPIVAQLRADGASLQGVADELNAMGHLTQRATPWQRGTIYTLLRREKMSVNPPEAWIGSSMQRREQVETTTKRYAALIEEITRRRRDGATMRDIAAIFNGRGLRTFRGRPWSAAGLNNLLQRQGGVVR